MLSLNEGRANVGMAWDRGPKDGRHLKGCTFHDRGRVYTSAQKGVLI